jgi:hypothetical protein
MAEMIPTTTGQGNGHENPGDLGLKRGLADAEGIWRGASVLRIEQDAIVDDQ